jgi:hypothetical protein
MEATLSSETQVYNKPTKRHIPEGGILHSQCRENLRVYIFNLDSFCDKSYILYWPWSFKNQPDEAQFDRTCSSCLIC